MVHLGGESHILSDITTKENIKEVDPEKSLEAIMVCIYFIFLLIVIAENGDF